MMPILNMINVTLTTPSSPSPIEVATKAHTRLFVLYVAVLIVGGLLTTWLTVMVWRANNTQQDAVIADADARIAEANQKAQEASRKTRELEQQNLLLRADLNNAAEEVALLQKEAAEARTKQAQAEMALELLAEKQRSRSLNGAVFLRELRRVPKAKAEIWYNPEDPEAFGFALQIYGWLGKGYESGVPGAGWEVAEPRSIPTNAAFLNFPDAPLAVKAGAQMGLGIVAKKTPKK